MFAKLKLAGVFGACAIAVSGLTSGAVLAAEQAELKTVSAFQKGAMVSRTFEQLIDRVNSDPDAPVRFKVLGGPEVMPPFQLGNAVRTGVVDVGFLPGAFYTKIMPEADALKLSKHSPQELRENGGWDYIEGLWRDKMNAHYLANTNYGNVFHLYVNKPIEKPDLSGLKIRVTPVYRDFFQSLGATPVQTAPGEVYTALERGVVDGYGWPLQGIFDLGWHEQTEYRVDPGFYTVEVGALVNADKWDSLTEEQRDYLTEQAAWLEEQNATNIEVNETERKRQADYGIETIAFEGEEAEKFVDQAYEAGWKAIIQQSPEHGQKLKEILSK